MTIDSQKIIRAMIDTTLIKDKQLSGRHTSPGHILTISRECGSYGEEIARLCAERLNVHYFDRDLVEKIAKLAGEDPETFHRLEKKVSNMKPNWLETMFTNRPWMEAKYTRSLVSSLMGITRIGGVVLGRGANFILGSNACFRVRIIAPFNTRVERYAKRKGLDIDAAKYRVKEIDDERRNFIKTLYHKEINRPYSYDLSINTKRISIEVAVDMIMDGLDASSTCIHEKMKAS